jgi:hypothetical protein
VPKKATEYSTKLASGKGGDLPFDKIVNANIGNPQQSGLDQKPITWWRQVRALIRLRPPSCPRPRSGCSSGRLRMGRCMALPWWPISPGSSYQVLVVISTCWAGYHRFRIDDPPPSVLSDRDSDTGALADNFLFFMTRSPPCSNTLPFSRTPSSPKSTPRTSSSERPSCTSRSAVSVLTPAARVSTRFDSMSRNGWKVSFLSSCQQQYEQEVVRGQRSSQPLDLSPSLFRARRLPG